MESRSRLCIYASRATLRTKARPRRLGARGHGRRTARAAPAVGTSRAPRARATCVRAAVAGRARRRLAALLDGRPRHRVHDHDLSAGGVVVARGAVREQRLALGSEPVTRVFEAGRPSRSSRRTSIASSTGATSPPSRCTCTHRRWPGWGPTPSGETRSGAALGVVHGGAEAARSRGGAHSLSSGGDQLPAQLCAQVL